MKVYGVEILWKNDDVAGWSTPGGRLWELRPDGVYLFMGTEMGMGYTNVWGGEHKPGPAVAFSLGWDAFACTREKGPHGGGTVRHGPREAGGKPDDDDDGAGYVPELTLGGAKPWAVCVPAGRAIAAGRAWSAEFPPPTGGQMPGESDEGYIERLRQLTTAYAELTVGLQIAQLTANHRLRLLLTEAGEFAKSVADETPPDVLPFPGGTDHAG